MRPALEERDRRLRGGQRDEVVGVELVLVRKAALPAELELTRGAKCRLDVELRFERWVRAVAANYLLERALHGIVQVAAVSHDCDSAPRTEYAVDLDQRSIRVEPMEGLSDDDGIRGRGSQWHCLRRPSDHLHFIRWDLLAHGLDRLNRDHARAGRGEQAPELSRSRRQIDDYGADTQAEPADEIADGRCRVRWPH